VLPYDAMLAIEELGEDGVASAYGPQRLPLQGERDGAAWLECDGRYAVSEQTYVLTEPGVNRCSLHGLVCRRGIDHQPQVSIPAVHALEGVLGQPVLDHAVRVTIRRGPKDAIELIMLADDHLQFCDGLSNIHGTLPGQRIHGRRLIVVIVDGLDLRGRIDEDRGVGTGIFVNVGNDASIVVARIARIIVETVERRCHACDHDHNRQGEGKHGAAAPARASTQHSAGDHADPCSHEHVQSWSHQQDELEVDHRPAQGAQVHDGDGRRQVAGE